MRPVGSWVVETGAEGGGGGNEHLESSSHANNENDTPRGYRDCLGAEEPRDQEIGERRISSVMKRGVGAEMELSDAQWQAGFASARVIAIAIAPSLTNVGKTNFNTCFLAVFPLFLLLLVFIPVACSGLFCCFIFHSTAKYATVCARRGGGDIAGGG